MGRRAAKAIGQIYNHVKVTGEYIGEVKTKKVGWIEQEVATKMLNTKCLVCGNEKDVDRAYFMTGKFKCQCDKPQSKFVAVSHEKINNLRNLAMAMEQSDLKNEIITMIDDLKRKY